MELIKSYLYFPLAWYFRILARLRLQLWRPKIIAIIGSSGKTTLLHMLESQIGNIAKYSHHANSSYGIPFDILGLHRVSYTYLEWVKLFLLAPVNTFKKVPYEELYVVEADCDRPGEGKFLSELLRPDVTLWVSSDKTHSMNFDNLLKRKYSSTEAAIAHEFGQFLRRTRIKSFVNGDNEFIKHESMHAKKEVISLKQKEFLKHYAVDRQGTEFTVLGKKCQLPYLLPKEASYGVVMSIEICEYLGIVFDPKFTNFTLPPGRSSILKGNKKVTIIDSCYNANFASMQAILTMLESLKVPEKWVVLGDMLEQGKQTKIEHEKLGHLLETMKLEKVILYGAKGKEYIYPIVNKIFKDRVILVEQPQEVLNYLQKNLKGGETVLFKGGRLLEGVIARMLEDREDRAKLCRQDAYWEKKRKEVGL